MAQEYTQRLEKIETVLRMWLPENPDAQQSWMVHTFAGLEGMIRPELVKALTLPGWDLLNRGGKRWRPLLMTLICESLGGEDNALPLVPLVEFPHNASLIHDDIEDNSDERRGEPAIHIRYGLDTAINAGAFLYFLPLACVAAWDATVEQKNKVFSLWGDYMRRLHLGQAMDIQWHRDFASLPSIKEYELMCRLKTGSLARLAAILGVITAIPGDSRQHVAQDSNKLSERMASTLKILGEGAENLGMGFQILDDVQNLTTGNPGKKRGDDVVEGKKSLPILLYLHQRQDRSAWVARCFSAARIQGTVASEVEELIEALTRTGVLAEAAEQGRSLIKEARKVFSTIPGIGCETQSLLTGLIDFIGGDSLKVGNNAQNVGS
jgi:octaprenyl-diphosphate synthase